MELKFEKFKPGVHKNLLLVLSGILWTGVGIMLIFLAYQWLLAFTGSYKYLYAGIGILAALIIHHFGFLKIVDKNLGRISLMQGKPCAFAFMSWKSYLMVLIMVSMGIGLRHSPLPKQYLSVIYIGIGGALILSSIRYFRVLVKQIVTAENKQNRT
jgi:hypothetical protein